MSSTTISSTPSKSFIDAFISLLSRSNLHSPLTTAFITEIDHTPATADPAKTITPARLTAHFSLGIPLAARANVLLISSSASSSSSQFLAAALVEPPDFCGIPPSQARRDPGPILQEWRATARALKAKYLSLPDEGPGSYDTPAAPSQASGGPSEDPYPTDFNKDVDFETRRFFHLAILARDPDANNKKQVAEAVRACVEPVLQRAEEQGVPVWGEVGTAAARDEYLALGFRVAEEVVVGRGRVDARGWPAKGGEGEGVRCWAMIYDDYMK